MRAIFLAIPVVLSACGKPEEPMPAASPGMPAAAPGAGDVKDPVCKMQVAKDKAAGKAAHDGVTYYFCAESCLKDFQADPKKYAVSCACAKAGKRCRCEHCGDKNADCDCRK